MSESKPIVVSLNKVSVFYKVRFSFPDRSLERKIKALEEIDLAIPQGESLALLGPNGAGKTTLLKVIAGLLKPDRGEAKVNGIVRGIFELGAGFVPELTGFENLKYMLSFYNISDEKILHKIIEFSELGDFIYAPLNTYSQGMYLRLAFSIAINTNPDILLIDDVLAVGDFYFQKKCLQKIRNIIASDKTLILVTHNYNLAESLCKKCLILEKGKIIAEGQPDEIKNIFSNIDGNVWGIGVIGNQKIKLIFNNGRISLLYHNLPLTVDLGIFLSFKRKGATFYSTDFRWEVNESKNTIQTQGLDSREVICLLKMDLEENVLHFSLESRFPEMELNLILLNTYNQIQSEGEIFQLPPILEEPRREWHKVNEVYSNHLKIIPQSQSPYPILSLLSSPQDAKFEIFNFSFGKPARIIKIPVEESKLNFKLIFSNPKEFSNSARQKNIIMAELVERINELLMNWNKIERPILKKINFLSRYQKEALENFEVEVLNSDISSEFRALVNFQQPKFSLLFRSSTRNSSQVLFSLSPLGLKDSSFLAGLGLIFSPLYNYYFSSYLEGKIPLREHNASSQIFTSNWLKLSATPKGYPELTIKLSRKTLIEIGEDLYAPESINIKFLYKPESDDYNIELNL